MFLLFPARPGFTTCDHYKHVIVLFRHVSLGEYIYIHILSSVLALLQRDCVLLKIRNEAPRN